MKRGDMVSNLYRVEMTVAQLRLFRDMSFYMTQRSMETLVALLDKSDTMSQEMESLHLLAKVSNQHKVFQDYMLTLLEKAEDQVDDTKPMEMLVPEGMYKLMVLTSTMPSLSPESQHMKVTAAKTGVPMNLYTDLFNKIRDAVANARRVEPETEPEVYMTMKSPSKFIQ